MLEWARSYNVMMKLKRAFDIRDQVSFLELDDSESIGVATATTPAGDDDDVVALLDETLDDGNVQGLLNSALDILQPLVTGDEVKLLGLVDQEREKSAPQVHLSGSNLVSGNADDGADWSVLGDEVCRAVRREEK